MPWRIIRYLGQATPHPVGCRREIFRSLRGTFRFERRREFRQHLRGHEAGTSSGHAMLTRRGGNGTTAAGAHAAVPGKSRAWSHCSGAHVRPHPRSTRCTPADWRTR